MTRLGLALRLFFRTLGNKAFAGQARLLLDTDTASATPAAPAPSPAEARVPGKPAAPEPPARAARGRSDALELLAALQREARWVDFVQESIAGYSDAQVGAAVRDVHQGCAKVLDRAFALRPVLEQPEGSRAEVPAGFDAGRIRLTGNVTGAAPYHGTVQHAGWQATRVELPEWSGGEAARDVVAPAEVELR